ncbi:anti-sigma factor domain-containing protein [Epilithonimonas sp. UC225_85]|uniref:anti-sigma factor n=1 Tax=Epilithonimonas sp. UC225_85 TaxID=3350167 RepID=UPI0036D22C9F
MNIEEYISSGILESYILGLASPEEAGILECVMKNSAEVRSAFEEAQKTLEDLATAQAVTPPDDLEIKIWTKIQQEQTVEESKPVISEKPEFKIGEITQEIYPNKAIKWQKYAIAASVLFFVSIIGNFFWINDISNNKKEIAQLQAEKKSQDLALKNSQEKLAILSNPDIISVPLKGVEKHPDSKAMVYWDSNSKDVYLNAESLPKAPKGMQYQLWALVDGKPVNAGMYTAEKDTRAVLANIQKAQAFAITLEKQGGSATPTMENMFVIGNI